MIPFCETCDGTGQVAYEWAAGDPEQPQEFTADCPVCGGTGI